jgi:hypothetical protein
VWNLRLELGHHIHPTPMRTTVFAQAQPLPTPVAPQTHQTSSLWASSTGTTGSDGWLRWGRLHAPIRWHPPLSDGQAPLWTRTTSRTRWERARGVCSSHCPLPSLPVATIVPGIRNRHQEAPSCQCCARASARRSKCTGRFASSIICTLASSLERLAAMFLPSCLDALTPYTNGYHLIPSHWSCPIFVETGEHE